MTEEAAREIFQMIKDHWDMYAEPPTVELWTAFLVGQDAEITTKAVAQLATTLSGKPKISDVKETIRIVENKRRLSEPVGEQRLSLPARPPKHPEWVWVWSWARHRRTPRCLIPFPHQAPSLNGVETDGMMSMTEYEKLREEWVAADSPKAEHPIPLAR